MINFKKYVYLIVFILATLLKAPSSSAISKEVSYQMKYLAVIPFGRVDLEFSKPDVFKMHLQPSKLIQFFTDLDVSLSAEKKGGQITYTEDIHSKVANPDHKTILYDRNKGMMTFTRGEFQGTQRKISKEVLDPLSLWEALQSIYALKQPTFRFLFNSNQKNYVIAGTSAQQGALYIANVTVSRDDKTHLPPKLKLRFYWNPNTPDDLPYKISANTLIGPFKLILHD